MRSDAIPESMWQRASECIAHNAGLHFPPERRTDLERGLTSAAADLGFSDTRSCLEWLLEAPPGAPRLHALMSHLTIGDTYFFRERGTFDALAHHVLPELIQRDKRTLRLWSAACSTGEEPYSLAILVRQLLPQWRDWDVTILATDINERSLQKAAEGVYGQWSFRNSPSGFRESFFTRTDQGRYAIREDIRKCVRFAQLNLAQESWPSWVTGPNAMDLILCRNVLMYFSNEQANRAAGNLLASLANEGWLAVSPSECSQTRFAQFSTINFPDCILYRKPRINTCGLVGAPSDPDSSERAAESAGAVQSDLQGRTDDSDTATAPDRPALHYAALARALANDGDLLEALDATERWIAADRIDPAAHYLQAMVQQELGHREAARRCLRRVTYLQSDFVLAHFALGNMALAEARHAEARRHFTNALELLQRKPPDEPLPESDGTTVASLAEIINTLLQRSPQLAAGVRK